jgi:hypothetical protein
MQSTLIQEMELRDLVLNSIVVELAETKKRMEKT